MNRVFLLLVAGTVLFTGGCTLAPKYSKPQLAIPAEWPQGRDCTNREIKVATVPMLKWKDFFADQKLQKIIELALKNNHDLLLAALNVERARALYGIKKSDLLPRVNLVGSGSKQRIPESLSSTGASMTSEQYGVSLGIASWELDFSGRIRSLKKQALEEYMATEQARRSAQISLIAEVSRVYLTLAADRENFRFAGSTLETRQAAYKLIEKRYKSGLASELDLKQAQIPVEAARYQIANYKQRIAEDQNALNLLAGSALPEEILPVNLSTISPLGEITAGLPSETLLNRPDILQAEHRLKGAYAFIGAARAALFPRISLTTSVGTASNDLSGLFSSGSGTWNFSPQIALPIFDARTWAALRVSKTDRKIILTQYEKTIQTAFREVADALAVQSTISEQLSAQESLVNAVSETYRLSDKRYKMGIDSYLGVLDAHRALYEQQQGLIALKLARRSNQVRLYAVLGGGAE